VWHSAEDLHDLGEQVIKAAVHAIASHMNDQLDAIGEVKDSQEPTPDTTARGAGDKMPSVAEITAWANTEFGDIPRLLGAFGNGGPELSEPSRNAMWSVVGVLDPTFKAQIHDQDGHLSSVMPAGAKRWRPDTGGDPNITIADREGAMIRRLNYWRGIAADNFNDNFVTKIPSKAEMQKSVAVALAVGVEAEQRIRQNANNDVWNIGQATIKFLDAMAGNCPASAQPVVGGLTIFGAVASVFAATGGMGAVLAGLGLASTVGSAITSDAPHRRSVSIHGEAAHATISGGSALSAISSMRGAIHRVVSQIPEQEQDLARVLNDISLNVRDDEMTVPAPTDVTGPASHTVHALSREGADNNLQFSPS